MEGLPDLPDAAIKASWTDLIQRMRPCPHGSACRRLQIGNMQPYAQCQAQAALAPMQLHASDGALDHVLQLISSITAIAGSVLFLAHLHVHVLL
jgi:hypothetical protein